ncbi:MAG: PAS domain S-box protein, partial [Methanobacterium sp.]
MENSKFREIYEKSPIGILFYDKDGTLTDANQSALKIAAISQLEDVKGTNLFDNPYVESHKEELLKDGYIKFESPINLDKIKEQGFYTPIKGGVIYIDYTISVTDSGFLAQLQEITEHKKAEEKNKRVLETIAESYMELDNEWRYVDVNSEYEEIYGFKKYELVGKVIWEVLPQAV